MSTERRLMRAPAVAHTMSPLLDDDTVLRIANDFFEFNITDPLTESYYVGINADQIRRMFRYFVVSALGGVGYDREAMRRAHRQHSITHELFDVVIGHLREAVVRHAPEMANIVLKVADYTRHDMVSSVDYATSKSDTLAAEIGLGGVRSYPNSNILSEATAEVEASGCISHQRRLARLQERERQENRGIQQLPTPVSSVSSSLNMRPLSSTSTCPFSNSYSMSTIMGSSIHSTQSLKSQRGDSGSMSISTTNNNKVIDTDEEQLPPSPLPLDGHVHRLNEEELHMLSRRFFERNTVDVRIRHYYHGVDSLRLHRMMTCFLNHVVQGIPYNRTRMRAVHRRLFVFDNSHFDAVLSNLSAVLYKDFPGMLNRDELAYIMAEAEQMRGDIVQTDDKSASRRASISQYIKTSLRRKRNDNHYKTMIE
jgi:truncated hemoglobin YjbI